MNDGREDKSLVKGTAENSIKPGFQGGSGGGEAPVGLRVDGKSKPGEGAEADSRAKARQDLKESESSAEAKPENAGDSVASAKAGEEEAKGFYSGSGKASLNAGGNSKKKNKISSRFFKRGPIIGIIFAIFGFGGLMAGVQTFLPFSLVAQFQETFNSMQVSASHRSRYFIYKQMDSGRVKDPIKKSIFGMNLKITNKQAKKLASQGIATNRNFEFDGKKITVLEYENGAKQKRVVVSDAATAEKMRQKGINAISFDAAYSGDSAFHEKYNAGSKTWRGHIANWFGANTKKMLKINNISRNRMDYKEESDPAKAKEEVKTKLGEGADEVKDPGYKVSVEEEDEDGNVKTKDSDGNENRLITDDQGPQKTKKPKTNEEVVKKLNDIAGKYTKGTSVMNMATNGFCAVVGVIGTINLLVIASEAAQILNLTSAYFETVDKTKAGYGDFTPIHTLTDFLVERKSNKHIQLTESGATVVEGDPDANINGTEMTTLNSEISYSNKTAMESAGIAALYDGGRVNPNDPSVASFNFSSSSKKILKGLGLGMTSYLSCLTARIAAGAINGAIKGVEIAACVVTLGAGCGPLILDFVSSIAASAAIATLVTCIITTIVPTVVNSMTRDLISDIGGEDLGNALASGGNMYLGAGHRANGGSLSTPEKYQQFAVVHQQSIADNARYERESLSPFDLTSKYTFLGSIMTKMMSYMTSSSLMSVVTSSSSIVSSSMVALTEPTAMAMNVAETIPDMEEYEKTCPDLASINAVGDSFCNPYMMTDTTTIAYDPAYDVIDRLDGEGNFEEENTSDDNVKIKGDSDLAKYILFCNQRESSFGVVDQNIADAVASWGKVRTENSNLDSVLNSTIGSIDVIGDVFDIVQSTQELNNLGYIDGESCVAGNTVNNAEAPDWSTSKYYQRFIEDQSLAESMGLIEKSAVAAFLDDYYEQNPLDESYEGVLARKTGLRKDTVIALLDTIDYYNYIANYDPSERYQFNDEMDIEKPVIFDEENVLAGEVVLPNAIVYRDIRNRSFAV